MTTVVTVSGLYLREHLRTRLTIVLLVAIPAIFVWTVAPILGQFATALGGSLAGSAAATLSAGWSAAFLAGSVGFFQTSSSRDADRRLALAGLGPLRCATARLGASFGLAVLVSTVAFGTLELRQGIAHPAHAALAILAFALIYLAIGTVVGSVVRGDLEGSLAVALVFLFDVFAGPGMTAGGGGLLAVLQPSRKAATLLLDAGSSMSSSSSAWIGAAVSSVVAIAVALIAFWWSARSKL